MKTTIRREIKVQRTPRLIQLCGKFDLPVKDKIVTTLDVDVEIPEQWNVGVIVGPSMAGKTTLAEELFSGKLIKQGDWQWPADMCLADGFSKSMCLADITGLLSSVGFSSPPDWTKPYFSLSNGGKFRADLARTLAERNDLAMIDEFGSFIHNQARVVAAAAAAKSIRRSGGKLVALCVHEDAVPFFEPDWVIEIGAGKARLKITRGLLRRPPIELQIIRTDSSTWPRFREAHYLNHDLHRNAACFVAMLGNEAVAFTAALHFPHPKRPGFREHRTVCLPDFQGMGIGNAVSEFVAGLFVATGKPYFSTTSHPAMVRHRVSRPHLWKLLNRPKCVDVRKGFKDSGKYQRLDASSRLTVTFEYIGPKKTDEAKELGVVLQAAA